MGTTTIRVPADMHRQLTYLADGRPLHHAVAALITVAGQHARECVDSEVLAKRAHREQRESDPVLHDQMVRAFAGLEGAPR